MTIPMIICENINLISHINLEHRLIQLVSISFNNADIILLQIKMLKQHIKDPYHLTIADNSTDKKIAREIKNICIKEEVGYLKLPSQLEFKMSRSHGIALNWVYKNYLLIIKPSYFGFLDHDIFPIRDITLIDILKKQEFFGLRHYAVHNNNTNVWEDNTPEYWYLWAGFCFYQMNYIKSKNVNFMPVIYNQMNFDTGGGNWKYLYRNKELTTTIFPKWVRKRIGEGTVRQFDYLDLIDDKWIHTINGSKWSNPGEDKKNIIFLIEKFKNE